MSLTHEEFAELQLENMPEVQPEDLTGKVIIITGANVGIGYETAKAIATMNPEKLILACRNPKKAEAAVKSIVEATGIKVVEAWDLDLASFTSVKAFAKRFDESKLKLHVLVNNAGSFPKEWGLTEDGFEFALQINHLSTMLLTLLLTKALKRTAEIDNVVSRIVVVSSEVHYWAEFPTKTSDHLIRALNEPSSFVPYNAFERYKVSKLLNVLFTREYARRLEAEANNSKLVIVSLNPGFTVSELGTKNAQGNGGKQEMKSINGIAQRPASEGAKTVIYCVIHPSITMGNGKFYTNMREREASIVTQGEEGDRLARKLWADSLEAIGANELGLEEWLTAEA